MDEERQSKSLRFALKAEAEREFRAVFATFDVVDHDGDVTRPGAFEAGKEVIVGSWGHKSHELPVGKGVIGQDEKEAWVDGEFFETGPGRDTYETVKNLGELGEWSYIYTPTKASFGEFEDSGQVRFLEGVKVFSVDPVLVGAGIGTRTDSIKSLSQLEFVEHMEELVRVLEAGKSRVDDRRELLAKEGRVLSAANVERLKSAASSLRSIGVDLEELVAAAEPQKLAGTDPSVLHEAARFGQLRRSFGL